MELPRDPLAGEGKYLSDVNGIVYPKHPEAVREMDKSNFEVTPGEHKSLQLMPTDEESKYILRVFMASANKQEQMVLVACAAMGIAGVAFRYQNVYGPNLSVTLTGILSIFFNTDNQKNGLPINILKTERKSRDFVLLMMWLLLPFWELIIPADNEVFNVGSGWQQPLWKWRRRWLKIMAARCLWCYGQL